MDKAQKEQRKKEQTEQLTSEVLNDISETLKKQESIKAHKKNSENKQNKHVELLVKTFQDTAQSIKKTISPGGLIKSMGLLTGNPLLMLFGDKIENMTDAFFEARKEQKEQFKQARDAQFQSQDTNEKFEVKQDDENEKFEVKKDDENDEEFEDLIEIQTDSLNIIEDVSDTLKKLLFSSNLMTEKLGVTESLISDQLNSFRQQTKDDFLQEDLQNKELEEKIRTNTLLEDLIDTTKKNKPLPVEKKSKLTKTKDFLKGIIKNPGKLLGGLLGGGMLTGAGLASITKVLKKGIFKLIGKIGVIFAGVFAAVDFVKGFENAMEISGYDEDTLRTKIQAGLSQAISGLTIGLLKPDSIYNVVDWIGEKLTKLMFEPFALLRSYVHGEIDYIDVISVMLSNISFGLISENDIQHILTKVYDKITSIIQTPFLILGDLIKGVNILDSIKNRIGDITFELFTVDDLSKGVKIANDYVIDLFTTAKTRLIDAIKNFSFIDTIDSIFGTGVGDILSNSIKKMKKSLTTKYNDLINLTKIPFQFVSSLYTNNILPATETAYEKFTADMTNVGSDLRDLIASPFIAIRDVFNNIVDFGRSEIKSAKESIEKFINNIKSSIDSILSMFKNSIDMISSLFDKINIFKSAKIEEPKDIEFKKIKRNSPAMNVEKEKDKLDSAKRIAENEKEQQKTEALTNIVQTTNNAIYPAPDMSIGTDDPTFAMLNLGY